MRQEKGFGNFFVVFELVLQKERKGKLWEKKSAWGVIENIKAHSQEFR